MKNLCLPTTGPLLLIFTELLKLFDKELTVRAPFVTVQLQDSSSEDESVNNSSVPPDDYPICLFGVKTSPGGSIQMECCQTTLHMDCYLRWLENSGSLCVICRQGVARSDQETEKDTKEDAI